MCVTLCVSVSVSLPLLEGRRSVRYESVCVRGGGGGGGWGEEGL